MRLKLTQAQANGLGGKRPRRQDRHAREFPTAGCRFEVQQFGAFVRVICTLPFPPSVNAAWRTYRNVTTLSADGKAFRAAVIKVMHGCPSFGDARLRVIVTLNEPDARRRDLGNFDKALMDALKHAGVYDDDSQIDDQRFFRGVKSKPGHVIVEIEKIS